MKSGKIKDLNKAAHFNISKKWKEIAYINYTNVL